MSRFMLSGAKFNIGVVDRPVMATPSGLSSHLYGLTLAKRTGLYIANDEDAASGQKHPGPQGLS